MAPELFSAPNSFAATPWAQRNRRTLMKVFKICSFSSPLFCLKFNYCSDLAALTANFSISKTVASFTAIGETVP